MIPSLPLREIQYDAYHAFISVIDLLQLVLVFGYKYNYILLHNYRFELEI